VRYPSTVATGAAVIFASSLLLTPLLGSEFLPELEEGSIAVNMVRLPSVSLNEAIRMTTAAERALLEFPEVESVVSRIGRPAIATDPMGTDMGDTYVLMKPPSEWTSAATRPEMVEVFEERLARVPGMAYSFSQPIRFRMMELVEGIGARSDVVVKIHGEDLETLQDTAAGVGEILEQISGAADVRVQQTDGLPLLQVSIDRTAIARYGLNAAEVQDIVRTAIAGTEVSEILEGPRRFALVVRLTPAARTDAEAFGRLPVGAPSGLQIPLRQLARIDEIEAPAVIGRENGMRSISVEANVRGRDIGTFVAEAQAAVDQQLALPVGYGMTWGGMWENLDSGRRRLAVVVPVTFFIIFLLLFATFNSLKQAALIFTGIPFAVTGGILALLLRDMNLSMSAGIGFVAVSGVAVLNGVVLVTFINQLRQRGTPTEDAVIGGALTRLRPVLMTAMVASLGFVPMALSTSAGAEVQRPLATVVVGGLITSTLLTLMVLPALYAWTHGQESQRAGVPDA
jgi:cobalt-zinc-cadmium resistance protein CzcA